MAIDIKEIVIRAAVGQNEGAAAAGTGPSPAAGGADPVQEAVEQAMQILEDKKQR